MSFYIKIVLTIAACFVPSVLFWLLISIRNTVRIIVKNITRRNVRNDWEHIRQGMKSYSLYTGIRHFVDKEWVEGETYENYRSNNIPSHWKISDETIAFEIERLKIIVSRLNLPHRWYRFPSLSYKKQRFLNANPSLIGLETKPRDEKYDKIYKEQGYAAAWDYEKSGWLYRFLKWVSVGRTFWNGFYKNRHGYGDKAKPVETSGQMWQKYFFLSQWNLRCGLHNTWWGLYRITWNLQTLLEGSSRGNLILLQLAERKLSWLKSALEWRKFIKNKDGVGGWLVPESNDTDFPADETWLRIPHGSSGYRGSDDDWMYEFSSLVLGEEFQERFGDYGEVWDSGGSYYYLRLFTNASRMHTTKAINFLEEYPDEGDWLQITYEDERRYDLESQQHVISLQWHPDEYVDEEKLEQIDHLTDSHSYAVLRHTSLQDIWDNKIPTPLEAMTALETGEHYVPSDMWMFESEFDSTMAVWEYLLSIQMQHNELYEGEETEGFSDSQFIRGLALLGVMDEEGVRKEVDNNAQKVAIWAHEQQQAKVEEREADWRLRYYGIGDVTNSIWDDIKDDAEALLTETDLKSYRNRSSIWDDLNDGLSPWLSEAEANKIRAQRLMKTLPGFED